MFNGIQTVEAREGTWDKIGEEVVWEWTGSPIGCSRWDSRTGTVVVHLTDACEECLGCISAKKTRARDVAPWGRESHLHATGAESQPRQPPARGDLRLS